MNKTTLAIILLAISALACSNTPDTTIVCVDALNVSCNLFMSEPTVNKPAATSLVPDEGKMAVCVDALNVRTAPGTSNETISDPLKCGVIVTLKGTPVISEDMGLWQEIITPVSGWVNKKHICNSD